MSSTAGRKMRARAIATRCCMPPESSAGKRRPWPREPDGLQHRLDTARRRGRAVSGPSARANDSPRMAAPRSRRRSATAAGPGSGARSRCACSPGRPRPTPRRSSRSRHRHWPARRRCEAASTCPIRSARRWRRSDLDRLGWRRPRARWTGASEGPKRLERCSITRPSRATPRSPAVRSGPIVTTPASSPSRYGKNQKQLRTRGPELLQELRQRQVPRGVRSDCG